MLIKETIQAAQRTPKTKSMIPRKREKKGLMIAFTNLSMPKTIFPIKEIPFDMALPGENNLDLLFFFLIPNLCSFR